MNTQPTPETDKALFDVQRGCNSFSFPDHARRMERERDEWKARYIQQNKDLGCELLDPNGTIWDHAQTLQRERDEARKIIAAVLSILPVGHIPSHTPESIPDRIRELVDSWISLERERDEWRN